MSIAQELSKLQIKVKSEITKTVGGPAFWGNSLDAPFQEAILKEKTKPLDNFVNNLDKKDKNFISNEKCLYVLVEGLDLINKPAVTENNGLALPDNVAIPEKMLGALATLAKFGCEDAISFAGHIHKSCAYYSSAQVMNRLWRYSKGIYGSNQEQAKNAAPGALKRCESLAEYYDKASSVLRLTKQAKCGICTTFGWAAAGVLLEDLYKPKTTSTSEVVVGGAPPINRVEVVGWKSGHVYAIINRKGGFASETVKKMGQTEIVTRWLPPASDWTDAVIVDCWLGTLGNEYLFKPSVAFRNPANDRFQEGNIESLFDSLQFPSNL